MKADIHPKYFTDAKVRCACGATYTVGSTKESYTIDICGSCHPFYTGKQKLVDTAGRVDKFMARQKIAAEKKAEMASRDEKRARHRTETVEEKVIRKVQEQEEAKQEEAVATKPAVKKPIAKKSIAIKKSAKSAIKKPVAKKSAPAKAKKLAPKKKK